MIAVDLDESKPKLAKPLGASEVLLPTKDEKVPESIRKKRGAASKVMFFEQEVVGSLGCRPVNFPKVLALAKSGRLKLGPLVTARMKLDQIHEALDELRAGKSVRTVILPT